jgi:hypothetical protein
MKGYTPEDFNFMKYLEEANPCSYKADQYLSPARGRGGRNEEHLLNRDGFSFWGDKNILNLMG